MTRRRRIALFALAGFVTGLILAMVAVQWLTRTSYAKEYVRQYAITWLDERVFGQIKIDRISGGGLLGGLTLHGFSIWDEDNRPFVITDSATVEYNWRTLVGGQIRLDRVKLWSPQLYIEQLPGDTAWNYQFIFADTTPDVGPDRRRLILFENAELVNATIVIRRPFEQDDPIAIDDTARLVLERVPGGIAKVMRFERVNAQLDRVVWESPIEEGRLFRVRNATGRGFIWKEPVTVTSLHGEVTTRDSIISFNVPRVVFGSSNAAVEGRVIMEEGLNFYDVIVDGSRLQFRDLHWLYPRFPQAGHANLTLRIQTQRPKGILWYASNARIVTPGTQMSGNFGVVVGDTLYFTDVNLRAAPLNVQLLEDILPGGLPVDGLLIGTVQVKGPLSE